MALTQQDYLSNTATIADLKTTVSEHFSNKEEAEEVLNTPTESNLKSMRKCISEKIRGVKSTEHTQANKTFGKNVIQTSEAHISGLGMDTADN